VHTKSFEFWLKTIQVPGSDQYNEFDKRLAQYTRSIGHPARVAVILALARHGTTPLREIIEIPGLSKSTVLQHLRELKRVGLIQGKLYGTKTEYSLDIQAIDEFNLQFTDFIARIHFPVKR
jgi:DNA-binding transcriptional ArsR family regulator